ncbi:outer membrane beta-barrel protein [Saccharospirillum sp. HFRX-1]|uniref:outer membrane beta-barrel protein n=1 Tax=unclassified Saccharospirillum TaxID=2633430 RepID=UPI00371E80F0
MRKIFLMSALALFASNYAFAERNPFLLAAGAGFGANSLTIYTPSDDFETDSDAGFVRSLKIGGIINQQHALYFHGQSSSFDMNAKGESLVYEDNTSMLLGLGYTYYLKPTVGSAYVEMTTGFSSFTINDNNTDVDSSGIGFLIGAGYELNQNVQFGATFRTTTTENDSASSEQEYGTSTIAAKVELKL